MFGVMGSAWVDIDGEYNPFNGVEEQGPSILAFATTYQKAVDWALDDQKSNNASVTTDHPLVGNVVEDNGNVVAVIVDKDDDETIYAFIVDEPDLPEFIG